jgi:hypothetical protein
MRYLGIVSAILLVVSTSVSAQWDVNGSVSGSVSGSDSITWGLTPLVGLGYQGNGWAIESKLNSQFNNETEYLFDSWQSNNSLRWQSKSNTLSSGAAWNRSETDSAVLIDYSIQGALNIKQTPTLSHQFSIAHTGNEQQSTESTNIVKDFSETISIATSWRSLPLSSWQLSSSISQFDSGTQTSFIGLQNTRNISRYLVSLSVNSNWAENEVKTRNFGGGMNIQRSFTLFDAAVSANRSQTDTLSLLNIEGLDLDIEQQSQVLSDQLRVAVTEIELLKTVVASFSYQWVNTQDLFDVSVLEIETQSRNQFETGSLVLTAKPSLSSTLQITNSRNKVNGEASFQTNVSWAQQLSKSWRWGAGINHTWSDGLPAWSVNLNYQL